MDKNEIHARLMEMVTPLCQARDLEVWGIDLLFAAGGRHKIVRVYLDSEHGVGIDECSEVSRQLSLALDVEDIIPGAFTLEVSSPGLERPFFSLEQLQAHVGQTVRIRMENPLEGRKNFKGRLLGVEPPMFTLTDDSNTFELNWDDVGKANLVYEPFDQGKKR
ncbi:ribosome maturation factor RimP [Desulfomicrobium norvegicum]|uniref:Ribosome maturation factor RimP n=1 Tax=Desulfomicrobium norvegicum (strain DSM 1741 / NCIMB 8310) TaxID=52561 RepID=A0A8G2C0U8_DESNO|nr:ribosome maturation factor RimP [Desulfomicrobium norvegicum]SFL32576.1 ribosome maturation factor RimP [Desulfomicrobium norvegicum]